MKTQDSSFHFLASSVFILSVCAGLASGIWWVVLGVVTVGGMYYPKQVAELTLGLGRGALVVFLSVLSAIVVPIGGNMVVIANFPGVNYLGGFLVMGMSLSLAYLVGKLIGVFDKENRSLRATRILLVVEPILLAIMNIGMFIQLNFYS